ncbi:hypothetical protein HK101_008751 [Irineochytrium annulatum]|nr:hypothetical protein HK101_008751 [Irineochytrium annulatum]
MLMQNGTGGPYISTLTPTQWSQLRTYQANYGVRLVALNDQPDGVYVSRYGGFWGVSDSNNIIVSPVTGVPYTSAAGLTSTWSLPATGLYHTPGTILNAAAATEVLQFGVFAPDYPVLTSAAVVLSYGNRTQMSFYFPCGSIWVQWGTRGLYNGFRRIYFVPQIDDIFLTTDGLDENGKAVGFRVSPADINGIISWQSDINARMPKGSDFRLEFAYNGNGILEMSADHTDYFLDIDVDLTDTPLDWVKPPGTGYNLWPQPISKLDQNWDANTLMQYDPLLAHLRTPAIRDQFYWCSHTFTHEILNNNSYADTIDEVTFNYKMGGPSYANVIGQPNWSNISMVTPGISGLFNADALRALWDFGIIAAVGDSSRPKTYDANMPYWWPLITTVANNGFDGFTIVPRQVLNIYFNVTNPNYLVTLYNQIYPTAHADFAYIMNAEVERVSRILMALSWNPYMFHQANLRNADMPLVPIPGTTRTARLGLCQQWVETILAWYGAHVTWPLVTIKLDDLTRAYWARKTSDTAGVRVWYKGTSVAGGGVQVGGLFVTAAVSCTAPVTLPLSVAASNVVVPAGGRIEQIGDDPVTVWVPLIGGAAPVQVSFHTAFVY